MLNSRFKSLVACFLCILFMFSLLPSSAVSGEAGLTLKEKLLKQATSTAQIKSVKNEDPYYSTVLQSYGVKGYKPANNQKIVLDAGKATASDKGDIPVSSGIGGSSTPVLVWKDTHDWFEWVVDIPQDGLYEIEAEYYPIEGMGALIQRGISIDGKVPFVEAYNIGFERFWKDDGPPKMSDNGDEIRPRQIETPRWAKFSLVDNQGHYSRPFQFYLSKGKHTIRMKYVDQPVAFKSLTIKSPEVLPTYEQVKTQYEQKGYKPATKSVKIQAESDVIYKSDSTLRREYDPDPMSEPYESGKRLLNIIGGARWKMGSQSMTWKMNVEEEGLYRIDLRMGQWWGDGLPSFRQIMIDGKVPFAELDQYSFQFQTGWRMETLEDSNKQPFQFYLTKGEHTLTMKSVLGPITGVVHDLIEDTLTLSEMYRRIVMITGQTPDPNYEYELGNNIPGLLDNLKKTADSLGKQAEVLESISVKRPGMANTFLTYKQNLDGMVAKPDTISTKLSSIYNAQTGIGNRIMEIQERPLILDYFVANPPDVKKINATSNFFQKMYVTFQNFLRSFYKDYNNIGDFTDDEVQVHTVIDVWVGRGKEWAEIMKQLADEDFTKKTGIGVRMNILPAGQLNAGNVNALLLAITSGKSPDIAAGLEVSSPVDFAIRDQVLDMSKFQDYNQVIKRFYPATLVPFEYKGGKYALPEQLDFKVMLYRKDILSELGIKIPNTYDELFNDILPVLYQNGMQFEPVPFGHYLFQMGGDFYTKDGLKSDLDSPIAMQAFKTFTDQWMSYGLPMNFNQFNRFRTGEMPIAMGGYGDYVKLLRAAPELFGRWDITMIPGLKKPDGTIDRTIGGVAGRAAVILKGAKNPEAAWEFLKWWTGTDTQIRFGRELEALIGIEARWNTSNKEAFKGLPWSREHREVILGQLEWSREVPQVLGGYYTNRMMDFALNRVRTGGQEPRDALEYAVKEINKEMRAKQEEYGIK